jgi:hypothetical protein
MASINPLYLVTLLVIQLVFLIFYTMRSTASLPILFVLFLIILGLDYVFIYTAGEWANSFIDRYFFWILFGLIMLLLLTLLTEIEYHNPIIAEFQHDFRYWMNSVFTSFGYAPPYKNTVRPYDAGCFKGEPGCDCDCACEGLRNVKSVYCNRTSCSCITAINL